VKRPILHMYSWIAVLALILPLLAACGADTSTATPVPPPPAAATATTGSTAPAAPTDTVAASNSGALKQLPRNQTLYIAGFQWQPPTNFNPLNGNPDWPSQGGFMEIYEALFAYNQFERQPGSAAGEGSEVA